MLSKNLPEALTFDDVLLVPAYSEVVPVQVSTLTQLTRDITLNTPLISSAMDTVTESRMAIAMAQQGGIGIVHRNLNIADQAGEIDKVKRSESGMIVDPVTISPDQMIGDALEVMRRYKISGVPVTQGKRLVGILTNRDLRFETRTDIPVGDVMTKKNLITVPVGTTLEEAELILHEHRVEKLLVVDDHYELKGLITVKDIQKKLKYPNASKDDQGRLRVGGAIGATGDFLERAAELVSARVDVLAIDSAHGHSSRVLDAVREVKKSFPQVGVLAGNVATYEGAMALIDAGADAVKVGFGPGSICTTRIVTGAGMPQITAIAEAARAAADRGIPVIADGGIKYSGEITKAIAAGASSVMIGSLFAGVDESPGEIVLFQGRSFKTYRGMGSLTAMSLGGGERYFQNGEDLSNPQVETEGVVQRERAGGNRLAKFVPEGIEGRVPYRGPLESMVYQLVGGLRSGMGYLGCGTVKELQEKAQFVRISGAGLRESHVHDVLITREAPNYHVE
jgi:IMP dehydrogenase